jgi:acyl-homoserine lactone acylase PvdQ
MGRTVPRLVLFLGVLAGLIAVLLATLVFPSVGPLEPPTTSPQVVLALSDVGTGTGDLSEAKIAFRRTQLGTLVLSNVKPDEEQKNKGITTHVNASFPDMLAALGFAHAHDRLSQMLLLRAVSRSELGEFTGLKTDPEVLKIDRTTRHFGFLREGKKALETNPRARCLCESFAAGVNAFLRGSAELSRGDWGGVGSNCGINTHGEERRGASGSRKVLVEARSAVSGAALGPAKALPVELGVAFSHFDARNVVWAPEDSMAMAGLTMWAGLAETQQWGEHFVLSALLSGKPGRGLVDALFPGQLAGLDEETLDALRRVDLKRAFVPFDVPAIVPTFKASNNFVVSKAKSAGDLGALLASDPHLHILQTPAIWYEVELQGWQPPSKCAARRASSAPSTGEYVAGITFPGLPSIIMGRSPSVSWAQTYGFADQIDYFVEHIVDSKYQVDEEWRDLVVLHEPTGVENETQTIFQTQEGHTIEILDSKDGSLPDG